MGSARGSYDSSHSSGRVRNAMTKLRRGAASWIEATSDAPLPSSAATRSVRGRSAPTASSMTMVVPSATTRQRPSAEVACNVCAA